MSTDDENRKRKGSSINPIVSSTAVEVRLFGAFQRYLRGKKSLNIKADDIQDILVSLPLERGEVGLVLVNKKPAESIWAGTNPLKTGDIIEIYPIVTGG